MVPAIRQAFNKAFTEQTYQSFLEDLNSKFPGAIDFRVAETPQFFPRSFLQKMTDTCDYIIDTFLQPSFKEATENAIPPGDRVAGKEGIPHCIAFDFGVCVDAHGEPEPQLIELQGFPTLFGFQALLPEVMRRHYTIPDGYSHFFSGLNRESYIQLLREIILADADPSEVILLEIRPHEQKTRIDFYCMQEMLGIQPVCITELFHEERNLFYKKNGVKTPVKRIYNRIIFDELHARKESLGPIIDLREDWNVTWVPHPNWFYRISKYMLPFLDHPHVPETWFLSDLKTPPADLQQFVLKPLFSFAGQGVVIDVTMEDIERIQDPEHWILQRKVTYADIIETPDVPAKVEIRLMYLWKEGDARPILATNLSRLSKGKMIGVRYNQDKTWVGGSVAFFES